MTTLAPSGQEKGNAFRQLHGEPFVWLTSMGLVLGLLMITALLAVVAKEGFGVFWPKKVALYELSSPSSGTSSGASSEWIAGELIKRQSKHRASGNDEAVHWERQLFTGNKNYYGMAFRFIDESDILSVQYPKDIAVIERSEYGDAFGTPVELLNEEQQKIDFQSPDFEKEFKKLIHNVAARRKTIRNIEKKQIGAINFKMRQIDLERSSIGRKNDAAGSDVNSEAKIETLNAEYAKLQASYEVLAKQARELHAKQKQSSLTIKLSNGELKTIRGDHVIHHYYPNRMNFFTRLMHFISGIWNFLTNEPREANTEGGIFPAIFGTLVMTLMMSVAVTPFGIVAAIYLREYAKQGAFVRMVRIAVNNLAGVPSIVFGVFGLGFFVYGLGSSIDKLFFANALPTPTFGTGGILWASLTLSLMTVPVVIVSTEEALAAVPRGTREGSLACGASKWQTIQRVVLPASAPGIMTGFILAMARGAGEVAPLMLVGVVKLAPTLPIDSLFPFIHPERKFMHLGFHIYDLGFQSPDSEAAKPMVFATALILILMVVLLNLTAIIIRQKLRKKYSIGAM